MIEKLMNEYLSCAEAAATVDYSDKKSVRQFNAMSDRMRIIVDEVVKLGQDAVKQFASLMDKEPAAASAAHLLIEMADLDSATLSRCFERVERAKEEAEAKGNLADAMIKEMWLKEWRNRKT